MSIDGCIKNVVHIYHMYMWNIILIKTCYNIDEPWDYCVQSNKPGTLGSVMNDFTIFSLAFGK
jgi:hypothetical protein